MAERSGRLIRRFRRAAPLVGLPAVWLAQPAPAAALLGAAGTVATARAQTAASGGTTRALTFWVGPRRMATKRGELPVS